MKNNDKVTIKDLEQEIGDLRNGMRQMTITLAQERQTNEALTRALHTAKADAVRAGEEVNIQLSYQARAHETIERLSKVALMLTENR